MVTATRHLTYGPPITASPARLRADPTKLPFIRAWIKDFPVESISFDADAITEKPKELSFDSLASLYHMDDSYHAVLESKGFNPIHARLLVRDARALHETASYCRHNLHCSLTVACRLILLLLLLLLQSILQTILKS